jgi:hypothetical protein
MGELAEGPFVGVFDAEKLLTLGLSGCSLSNASIARFLAGLPWSDGDEASRSE